LLIGLGLFAFTPPMQAAAVNPVWADLFPKTMIDKNGKDVDRDTALGNKIVGIYFSASWCPPCNTFSPLLVNFRNKHSDEFEVVFASADNSKAEMLQYMIDKKMDFPAVECNTSGASALYSKYNITGIPSLVIVSPSDGTTITTGGRGDVTNKPGTAMEEWKSQVEWKDPPTISSFTGGHSFAGKKLTLSWNVTDASTLNISPGVGNVSTNSTSFKVSPNTTTTYTLTASNDFGTVTAYARALVFPNPPDNAWTIIQEEPAGTTDVIALGSEWSFYHPQDGTDPVDQDSDFYTTWMKATGYSGPGFQQSGKAMLGYGDINKAPGIVTNIGQPVSGARYTAYFKKEFIVAQNLDLGLEIFSDDGAIVYIDGEEVLRTANFSKPDAFHELASGNCDENTTQLYGMGTVGPGTHTIAVSVHNATSSSSDLGFDLRLFSTSQHGEFANWSTDNGLSLRPVSDQAMDADPDQDGKPNLLEYALGGDPLASGQDELHETSADTTQASITFVRVKESLDSALYYKVQLCSDIKAMDWQDGVLWMEGESQGVDQNNLPDGKSFANSRFERVRATFRQSPIRPVEKAFLRIVVTRN